jgi:hypothetical protein
MLDMLDHALRISGHVIVPDPDDPPTISRQPRGSPFISRAIRMLAAVHFDDQPMADRDEIGHVGADGSLPTKLVAGEPPISKHEPQALLGVCLFLPQSASHFAGH